MTQNKKIVDYFGGCHGKFLELVINGWIEKVPFDKTVPFFNDIGACHLRAADYKPEFESFHWSYYDLPMHQDAVFVRIRVDQSDMLVAATNSFCRAGDVGLDLYQLDKDTADKLSHPKHRPMLEDLIKEHGASPEYPRSLLRRRFFCMLDQVELGQKNYDSFKDAKISWDFPFWSLFDKQKFWAELDKLARWLGRDFSPDQYLDHVYADFIDRNQGYRSYVYCEQLITKIKDRINEPVRTNILEEAYVIKKLRDLRLHDVSQHMMRDRFENTLDFCL